MNFGITTSGCAQIEAGYGWSGGNTYVGGFSWEGATTLYGERCNATISLPMNGIVETALNNIRTDFVNIFDEEVGNNVPEELQIIIRDNNIDTQIADYLLNPSEPFPSRSDINEAFASLPHIPGYAHEIEELRQKTLRFADMVNDARDTVQDLQTLDDRNAGGKMYGLGVKAHLQGNYHIAERTSLFLGLNFNAAVRGTFHTNPHQNFISEEKITIPFYGYETTLSAGVTHNLNDDWSLSTSFHVPHSEFEVLLDGATLTKNDSPYVELSAKWNDQLSVGLTHRDGNTGINAQLQMNF